MSAQPFLIRGHHLKVYAELASWRAGPRDLARSLVKRQLHNKREGSGQQEYAKDVIGASTDQAKLMVARYEALFRRFTQLEQTDRVIITNGQKDHICQCCIVGHHCGDRGQERAMETDQGVVAVYEKDIDDMWPISAFKRLAESLAAKGSIDPGLGAATALGTPAEPSPTAIPITGSNMIEYEPSLEVSAGYVKTVLAHWTLAQSLRFDALPA